MKIIDRRRLLRELRICGYELVRQSGSHEVYKNGKTTKVVPIRLNPCIAARIHRELEREK